MECKLCSREKQIPKYFKHAPHKKVCDECLEMMGCRMGDVGESVRLEFEKNFQKEITRSVQVALPAMLEKLMVKSGMEFTLTVR